MLANSIKLGFINNTLMNFFSTMRFAKTHEWVKLDGDIATVGVTDHAQKELGEIVYVELPKADAEIEKGGVVSTIETVKTVAQVFSPLKGTVIEANQELNKNQTLLNKSPEEDGWIAKLKVDKDEAEGEMEKLLTLEDYKKLL